MRKQNPIDYGLFLVTLALYAVLGFVVERHETLLLIGSYVAVFTLYLYIAHKSNDEAGAFWFYASIAIRGMLLFSIPHLSDDFHRFIWDGRLLASGYHPFAEVPAYYIEQDLSIPGINEELFQKLNSPDYFTIYPPLAQFIFWLSVKLSPHSIHGSVVVMKLIIFLSEIGTLLVIKKLLFQFGLPASRVLLYALNPLVILELSGNIHLEAVLIFFLLLSLLLLIRKQLILSGIAMAMAICVKLIPLIFLPALLPRLGWKKAFVFYATISVVAAVLFLPLLDRSILWGFQNSLAYYFRKFEFNASIYYLVREWGYWNYGYNIIQAAGWQLALVSTMTILLISFKSIRGTEDRKVDRRIPKIFMFALLTYFLFTTTLHPWYITTLFALSIFTTFRFALLWTAMIFLTYAGYTINGFHENLWLVLIEYISVLGYLAFELLWKRKEPLLPA
jgi:alpha-1,6-mannosyltransferase